MGIPFLPDEIFAKILPHLHPDDILKSVSPACQRLHFLATDPLLWRGICVTHFRAFSAEHRFGELLDGPPREVDWLALYRLRKRRNAHALQLLEDMTKSSVLQLDKMDILCAFDYDVKELLIDHAQSDPYQEDGFSRA
jgi:F-box protein 21